MSSKSFICSLRATGFAALAALAASACTEGGSLIGSYEDGEPAADKFFRAAEPIANRYIVVVDAPKNPRARSLMDIDGLAGQLTSTYAAKTRSTFKAAVAGFTAEMSEADAVRMSKDPRVVLVEEDGVVHASATQTGATWGLDRLDQRDNNLDGSYTFANDGRGVTAYIIDTGININHRDFGGRAREGFSAIDDGKGAVDCNGHGSHVAGTVGGSTWGVAKGVDLVAIRVLDCNGSGSNSGVIEGVNWVAEHAQGPSVANMSLGGGASAALDQAVEAAIQAGVTFAVAAGNEDADACNGSPSRLGSAITVGASTDADRRASFSNFGRCVDIFAPGQDITSVDFSNNSGDTTMSGTSMASPHVAGVAALYLAAHPGSTPQQVRDGLVAEGTSGKIADVKGSPNTLLFTGSIGQGGEQPQPPTNPDEPQPPTNPDQPEPPTGDVGTPQEASDDGSVRTGRFVRYEALKVVPGTQLVVATSGSGGDADLYVRFGANPTTSINDCASIGEDSNERCELTVPADATEAFVSVRGYKAASYHIDFSWVEPTN